MLKYAPPKYIENYLTYNRVPIDNIPESVVSGVAERITRLQSKDPLVSLIFIAYNEQDYIFTTLLSLSHLETSYPLEIIVVNNNSTDDTQKIIDKAKVISVFEKNQGYAYARQAGLKIARGKYIISGDTDTLYPKNWVDPMIDPMEKDNKVVCTYNRFRFYREDGKYTFGLYLYEQGRILDSYIKAYKRPHLNVRGFSMAYRHDTAKKVGGYNVEVKRGSDGYLGIELLDHGKLKMVTNRDATVYTNMRRAIMQGGLFQNFTKRLFETMRYFFHMFTPQKDR